MVRKREGKTKMGKKTWAETMSGGRDENCRKLEKNMMTL